MDQKLNIKILDIEEGGILVTEINRLCDLKTMSFPMLVELDIETFDKHELKLLPILSNKERQRYITYQKWKDARRFILSRAALRLILSNFCDIPYQLLEFSETLDKKPFLIHKGSKKLEFNLSHTDEKIVIAIDERAIGVDVENSNNAARPEIIGPKVLTTEEQLAVVNSGDARNAFCLYWTRKEAFLKAIGKGIDDEIVKVPALSGDYQFWLGMDTPHTSWTVASWPSSDAHFISVAFQNQEQITAINRIKIGKDTLLNQI